MVVTRGSRARSTDIPPEVISRIVAAACPDERALSAGSSATCRSLRSILLSSCTATKLRRFGRGRQIAPLLQRLTGAERPYSDLLQGCRMHDTARIAFSVTAVRLYLRAGLQQVTLASCAFDTVLWQELEQLQHLQHLTLP